MRWAALLRGINAGVKLPMADFRTFLSDQGMIDVKTLLASGNAVFSTDEDDAGKLEARLHRAMKHRFGIDTGWFLRSHAELKAIVAANPFSDAARTHPNHLQVHFSRGSIDAKLIAKVAEIYDGPERLKAHGRELYVDYPDDIGHSKLPQAMAKVKLAVGATGRNWNTVVKLVDLTAASAA